MDTIKAFEQISFSWSGLPGRTLLEDAMTDDAPVGGAGTFGAHMVFTPKTTTLAEQISLLSAAIGLQPWMEKEPMLSMLLAMVLLAAISPVDMHILDDVTGKTLSVIKKMSRKLIFDKANAKALLKVTDGAEYAIQQLMQLGLLRESSNGDLVIQRKILANIKVS